MSEWLIGIGIAALLFFSAVILVNLIAILEELQKIAELLREIRSTLNRQFNGSM
jgi:hypothetical protein